MASAAVSFIDIAVLEDVRTRFAAGDALAILSTDLSEVIWANGAGAALLGYPDIETVMGAAPNLPHAARRQIEATPGFPRIGRDRPVAVRLASGTRSRMVPFIASELTLVGGLQAILLAEPAKASTASDIGEAAARAIQGFSEAGYFAAMLDEAAYVAASSPGFENLGISAETLGALVSDVASESDRLIKRLIPARAGQIPAGLARLTDDPAIHLLITAHDPVEVLAEAETGPEPDDLLPIPSDADLPDLVSEVTPEPVEPPSENHQEGDADHWYFSDDKRSSDATMPADVLEVANTNSKPDPVRFVWRTDASDAFSSISDEFVQAVGVEAADVIGRSFRDVAETLELDPSGEIAALLERRDTWSGRTVLWPIAGSNRSAPVDLAALPVYNRDRVFEGFRGFGVIRIGDSVIDPDARGLGLRAPAPLPEAPDAEIPTLDVEDLERDDIKGETEPDLETPKDDKVIRLAEHRPQQRQERHLSPSDRSAFEEIRARLQRDFLAAQEEKAAREAQKTRGSDLDAVNLDSTDQGEAVPAGQDETATDKPVEAVVEEASAPVAKTQTNEEQSEPQAERSDAHSAQGLGIAPRDVDYLPSAFATGGRPSVEPDLIAHLPIPLLVHAGDELYFANQEFLELTGYASLDQIRREGGLDRLFVDCDDEARESGRVVVRTLGGEEIAVEAHLQSVRWEGHSALLLSLRRKEQEKPHQPAPQEPIISERTQEDTDRQIEMMRTILDTATDGVILINPDTTIRSISRPAEALFGFDSVAVEGKPFHTLFAIESRKSAQDYLAGLSGNGVASILNDGREVIGREAQGRFIPLFMTIGKLPEDSGFCAVLRDITQWKRAEEQLTQARAQAERASSQKTEFLARVSHEIRTPLNAIIGFSELMMDEKFGPIGSDRYRDYLRDINRSGNHVLDLVNDLLDISKIEAGEQEMNYEAVSLNDSLAETVAMMQPQANRERVIIRSSLASNLPEVVADLRSVRQIALNLLSNAIRYTQAGGQVIVSTSYETSGDVAMRVRDTGIGMSVAEIDQALKPFKQISALKRGRHDGTGLGLPLTKAMVEANRARFTITSTPAEGTMVEVVFPSTRVLAE